MTQHSRENPSTPAIGLQLYTGKDQLDKDLTRADPAGTGLQLAGIHLGGGIVDWPAVLVAAARAGVTACFIEQEAPFPAPVLEELIACDTAQTLRATG